MQWKHVCHLGSFPRGKGYFASRVNYYSNSNCSFHLIRLIVGGDISVNPGPEKCAVCLKIVARNHRALSCDHFDSWCHMKCGDVTPENSNRWMASPGSVLIISFPFSNTTLNSTINTSIDSFMDSTGEPQVDEIANYKTNILSYYKYNMSIAHVNINSIWN